MPRIGGNGLYLLLIAIQRVGIESFFLAPEELLEILPQLRRFVSQRGGEFRLLEIIEDGYLLDSCYRKMQYMAMVEDYPHNLLELEQMFSTDEACRQYLARLRWPDGFRCPQCGQSSDVWPIRKNLLQCAACKYQASVTAGTIFQDTHTSLTIWFRAMWWVTTQKSGASALGLQRVLGLKSYETAWTWLHKFRRAMVRPGRELLSGRVEVDECYIGAPEEEMRGRGGAEKTLVMVAVEEDGPSIGRIRFRQIPNASAETLNRFLQDSVALGSVVHTDGWRGYGKVRSLGYEHEVTVLKHEKEEASDLLPHVHLVISLLKRWLMGTHQGAVSHKHLDYYLDEFTFRFNRRKSINRGKLFYRLVQQAVAIEPVTLDEILHPEVKKSLPRKVSAKEPNKAVLSQHATVA